MTEFDFLLNSTFPIQNPILTNLLTRYTKQGAMMRPLGSVSLVALP